MNAVDTNIWIYVHDRRDPGKQQKAAGLIRGLEEHVLLWQVGCEFLAAARKLQDQGFSMETAWTALDDMQAMSVSVIVPTPAVWTRTRGLMQSHNFSFWDGLLVSTCLESGVTTLYSEDFDAYPEIEGMSIINPFTGP